MICPLVGHPSRCSDSPARHWLWRFYPRFIDWVVPGYQTGTLKATGLSYSKPCTDLPYRCIQAASVVPVVATPAQIPTGPQSGLLSGNSLMWTSSTGGNTTVINPMALQALCQALTLYTTRKMQKSHIIAHNNLTFLARFSYKYLNLMRTLIVWILLYYSNQVL